jgi:hypothetical protein
MADRFSDLNLDLADLESNASATSPSLIIARATAALSR